MTAERAAYPLLFTFREPIATPAFVAGVTVSGRALMVHEGEDGWWLYGVQPGGMAENGETPQEAYARFYNAFKVIVTDLAVEHPEYVGFEQAARQFFNGIDANDEGRWRSAADAIRSGRMVPEAPFTELPRLPQETQSYLQVERLDRQTKTASAYNIKTYATAA